MRARQARHAPMCPRKIHTRPTARWQQGMACMCVADSSVCGCHMRARGWAGGQRPHDTHSAGCQGSGRTPQWQWQGQCRASQRSLHTRHGGRTAPPRDTRTQCARAVSSGAHVLVWVSSVHVHARSLAALPPVISPAPRPVSTVHRQHRATTPCATTHTRAHRQAVGSTTEPLGHLPSRPGV